MTLKEEIWQTARSQSQTSKQTLDCRGTLYPLGDHPVEKRSPGSRMVHSHVQEASHKWQEASTDEQGVPDKTQI